MKAIEAVGTIDQDRRVVLDEPLPEGVAGRVRLIILLGEDEPSEQEWLRAVAQGDHRARFASKAATVTTPVNRIPRLPGAA